MQSTSNAWPIAMAEGISRQSLTCRAACRMARRRKTFKKMKKKRPPPGSKQKRKERKTSPTPHRHWHVRGKSGVPSHPLDGEIRDGRHVMPVRVYYEDTDFS